MKKLSLNKLTVTSLSETMMRSIHGGFADTYGDQCTATCDTGNTTAQPTCTEVTDHHSNPTQCPSYATDCGGNTVTQCGMQNCATQESCTRGHCTDTAATYNDVGCPSHDECVPDTNVCTG